MINDSDIKVRASSLEYAEQAEAMLLDSLSIRWAYAGSLFNVADLKKTKAEWVRAVSAYQSALQLAKTEEDKSTLKVYLKLAQENAEKAK